MLDPDYLDMVCLFLTGTIDPDDDNLDISDTAVAPVVPDE